MAHFSFWSYASWLAANFSGFCSETESFPKTNRLEIFTQCQGPLKAGQVWFELLTFFSSPDPKGHVSFCHHFASVVVGVVVVVRVCKLFILSSSSLKPLNWFGPNLADMFIGRSSTKFVIFVPIAYPRWPPWLDLV